MALNVSEIEREIFHQALCAGDFSLAKKRLVKLTSGVTKTNLNL